MGVLDVHRARSQLLTSQGLCTRCNTGYTVRAGGRACYCAPGELRWSGAPAA